MSLLGICIFNYVHDRARSQDALLLIPKFSHIASAHQLLLGLYRTIGLTKSLLQVALHAP